MYFVEPNTQCFSPINVSYQMSEIKIFSYYHIILKNIAKIKISNFKSVIEMITHTIFKTNFFHFYNFSAQKVYLETYVLNNVSK